MRKLWLIFAQTVTVALALLFVVSTLKPEWLQDGWLPGRATLNHTGAVPVVISAPARQPSAEPTSGLSLAASVASPAVVSVVATKEGEERGDADAWQRYFFGQGGHPQAPGPQIGLGSGVIASPQGYLLTNHHVIAGADEIKVRLADGRESPAQLIGTDPESDVAVLKIDLDRLPVIHLGRIDELHVGDEVLAIGNPFNVGQTVTSGIVSALGRSGLGLSTFENFIQTDAAINPGNSGGALVDAQGNLIGINTAIFSRSGGSMGIGFAIPVDVARQVMDGLVTAGVVTRGWIGVQPQDLTPQFVQSFQLPVSSGVLIVGVLDGGPASAAGIRAGDVVVSINTEKIANTAQLMNVVAALRPQALAEIGLQRGDDELKVQLTVGQRPPVETPR